MHTKSESRKKTHTHSRLLWTSFRSTAHVRTHTNGRAMCRIFETFRKDAWTINLKIEKWLDCDWDCDGRVLEILSISNYATRRSFHFFHSMHFYINPCGDAMESKTRLNYCVEEQFIANATTSGANRFSFLQSIFSSFFFSSIFNEIIDAYSTPRMNCIHPFSFLRISDEDRRRCKMLDILVRL